MAVVPERPRASAALSHSSLDIILSQLVPLVTLVYMGIAAEYKIFVFKVCFLHKMSSKSNDLKHSSRLIMNECH